MLPARPKDRMLYHKGIVLAYTAYLFMDNSESTTSLAHAQEAEAIFLELGAVEDVVRIHKLLENHNISKVS